MFSIKKTILLSVVSTLLLCLDNVKAQEIIVDSVIVHIADAIQQGNADSLSIYFNQRIELSLPEFSAISSRNQAKMMISKFFVTNHPASFYIVSQNESTGGFFIVGTMQSEKQTFRISFLTRQSHSQLKIYQFSIE